MIILERIIAALSLQSGECKQEDSINGDGEYTSNGEHDRNPLEDNLLEGNLLVEVDHKEPCH